MKIILSKYVGDTSIDLFVIRHINISPIKYYKHYTIGSDSIKVLWDLLIYNNHIGQGYI